ncbi:MAG TPA: serine/threonine-protein kinase, partial [Ktedonobacteraceae bacterium]|nr:serine/threonine-protein kinase [Ktedonobacteraceae bacterium]
HRDIKPENILIHQEDRRLVITDFGIARSLEPGARVGKTITVRGTVGYMAPEQTSGVVDPRSDQFGSAVVLYEMLTGYHPFDSTGGGPIIPPTSLNHELPSGLDTVIARGLAPRPEQRYTDMMEFLREFNTALRPSGSMRAITPSAPSAPQRDSQRIPAARSVPNPITPANLSGKERGDSTGRQQAVRINTSSVREKCQEGDALLKQQQYTQALQAYEEALRLDARNFHAWNGKGTAHYSLGNYKKAYEAYQRATEIDADNPVVWVSTGLALNRLARHSQALVHFERALALDPSYVTAWNGKADTLLTMNMPEDAMTAYMKALAYDQQSFSAWNGLGNARTYLRDYPGAVEAYDHALLVNPRSVVAWCNKAEALMRYGHTFAAIDALNEATELDRSYAPAWTLKAEAYEAVGNHQEAQKARIRARPWGTMG